MKLLLLAMMLCMVAAAQTNSTHKTRKAQPKSGNRSQAVSCRSDDFMRDSLALSPVSASQAGYHLHTDPLTQQTVELDAQLDDFSPAAIERQRKFYSAWQDCKGTRVSIQDAVDWQLIDDQIALNLLDLNQMHAYQHNPTVYVELIGNALFLPLTQNYASKEIRLGHVLARMEQVPRLVQQAEAMLVDADPIYVKVAVEENDGNIDLIQGDVKEQIGDNAA